MQTGRVIFFDDTKAFGFIEPGDSRRRCFLSPKGASQRRREA
jgi:cold shock CspA family protein